MHEVRNVGDLVELTAWLNRVVKPTLTPDISGYAHGRMRTWLGIEPPLRTTQTEKPGLAVKPEIIDYLRKLINWKFDYCLVTYSTASSKGIEPHRDASYADYEAYGLNVNAPCEFHYWNDRKAFGFALPSPVKSEGPEIIYLQPGDLIRFNCKNLHAAYPSPNRWGMNFWRAKPVKA